MSRINDVLLLIEEGVSSEEAYRIVLRRMGILYAKDKPKAPSLERRNKNEKNRL